MKFISGADGLLPLLIGAFFVSGVIALIVTPLVRTLVSRRGIVDAPNHRRVNTSPVPRGGGTAVVIAFLIVGGGLTVFRSEMGVMPVPIGITPGQLVALFGGQWELDYCIRQNPKLKFNSVRT